MGRPGLEPGTNPDKVGAAQLERCEFKNWMAFIGFFILLRRFSSARASGIEATSRDAISCSSPPNAHHFVETLEECGVSLYWHAQGIETLLPNGKRNPASGIMLALLAEMARSEGELLRERINSGLREARRKGIKLGRPKGTALNRRDFLQKHKDILL